MKTRNMRPRPTGAMRLIWDSQSIIHNPMFDGKGRVWLTARVRPAEDPAFCKAGSDNPSAKLFPLATSGRQFSVYDPKTQKFTLVDTCFSTMHLQFGFDPDDTLWSSPPNAQVLGWLDSKTFRQTGDAAKSQGWTPFIVDTIGNGKRDAATRYTEPGKPIEPGKDARIAVGLYAVSPDPAGGIVWGSVQQSLGPGAIVRVDLGSDPPATALDRILQNSGSRLRLARHGRGQQRRRVDRPRKRAVREFRSPQMQGSAQRTGGCFRHAVPGRLDLLCTSQGRTSPA